MEMLFFVCAALTALAGVLVWVYARRRKPIAKPVAPLTVELQASAEADA